MVVATSCAAQQNSRTIIGDSIYFKSFDGSSELIIESGSKTTTGGVLVNTGNGRTQFVQLDSSLFNGTDNKIRYDVINRYIQVYIDTAWQNVPTYKDTTITIDSTDIANLHTTPITLVDAPGANKAIMFITAYQALTYNTTPWTGGLISIYIDGQVSLSTTAFNQSDSNSISTFMTDGVNGNGTVLKNTALTMSSTGALTGGDSGGSIVVTYRIIEF